MIRGFLCSEALVFVAAALVHFGLVIEGYGHQKAAVAESLIGTVLVLAFALTWMRPSWMLGVGLAAQSFALFGTLVGLFTVAIDIGPRTAADLVYHAAMLFVLGAGVIAAVWGLTSSKPEVLSSPSWPSN
jgi:hypothetical protein